MSSAVYHQDRVDQSQVAQHREQIDKVFSEISARLFDLNKSLLHLPASADLRSKIDPQLKVKLFNSVFYIASVCTSVAKELMSKLKTWAEDSLVPEYKKLLDPALEEDGDDEAFFYWVSRNFNCYRRIAEFAGTVFHNFPNYLCESKTCPKTATPERILYRAFRDEFYEKVRNTVQAIFFRLLTITRKTGEISKLEELKSIASFFSDVGRFISITLDERAAKIYREDFIEPYINHMIADNKAIVNSVPADELAGWIQRRADFERTLLEKLIAPENNIHEVILKRFKDEFVAVGEDKAE